MRVSVYESVVDLWGLGRSRRRYDKMINCHAMSAMLRRVAVVCDYVRRWREM